jgi:sulfoxide reductase heme-binding subunit YedZ
LYGFLYAVVHVWNYAVWENGLDWELIARDLEERRAMAVGLLALLALIPLAATSTRGWQRRLGKRWRTLHRLVYVAVPLSVWHFLWLERDITCPSSMLAWSRRCWRCVCHSCGTPCVAAAPGRDK